MCGVKILSQPLESIGIFFFFCVTSSTVANDSEFVSDVFSWCAETQSTHRMAPAAHLASSVLAGCSFLCCSCLCLQWEWPLSLLLRVNGRWQLTQQVDTNAVFEEEQLRRDVTVIYDVRGHEMQRWFVIWFVALAALTTPSRPPPDPTADCWVSRSGPAAGLLPLFMPLLPLLTYWPGFWIHHGPVACAGVHSKPAAVISFYHLRYQLELSLNDYCKNLVRWPSSVYFTSVQMFYSQLE